MTNDQIRATLKPMYVELPEELNIADTFLDARIREGRGHKTALITDDGSLTYAEIQGRANRFRHALRRLGVEEEQRVLIGVPDSAAFVSTLFGTLKNGSVVVMVNGQLGVDDIGYFYRYTRAKVAVIHRAQAHNFAAAARTSSYGRDLRHVVIVDGADRADREDGSGESAHEAGGASELASEFAGAFGSAQVHDYRQLLATASAETDNYPTHRDDAAIWLFSGGTTGRPKAVMQTHGAFLNTTKLYGHGVLGFVESDITLSVPKLYFGYALGTNLFFPFSVGATSIVFSERVTVEGLYARIRRYRPTILINVPTMISRMVHHRDAEDQDLSCLRFVTSAGEALPVDLHRRWQECFGSELLDGLGTAEMWHVFISNRPGQVKPGTLGKVVPGFEIRVCDDDGGELAPGQVGWLWVKGQSRAIGYWHKHAQSMATFRGEWYVSGDMVVKDADGYVSFCGRGDDMLKVAGKWLAPGEVEGCLLQHRAIKDAAVVGIVNHEGLTKPHAFVTLAEGEQPQDGFAEELKDYVRQTLEPYKAPREVHVVASMPHTHLGKIDRGKLRTLVDGD